MLGWCSQIKLDATEIGCGQEEQSERSQMPGMHKRGSKSSVVIGQYDRRSTQPDECKSQSERSRRKKELRIRKKVPTGACGKTRQEVTGVTIDKFVPEK